MYVKAETLDAWDRTLYLMDTNVEIRPPALVARALVEPKNSVQYVFAISKSDLGCRTLLKYKIFTGDAPPSQQVTCHIPPYRRRKSKTFFLEC